MVSLFPSRCTILLSYYGMHAHFSVATIKRQGVLLYNGRYLADNDFILLNLNAGYPEFIFSLGGRSYTIVSLPKIPENFISDGQWHHIKIEYLDKVSDFHLNRGISHIFSFKKS